MTPQLPSPTPTPAPSSNPGGINLDSVVASVSGGTSSSGGSSGDYGLTSEAQGATFDITGLPDLGTGKLSGKDLINAFLAAGTSGDPQRAATVAAIQHALYFAGYYTSSYVPTWGTAKKDDASAFAAAINDLWHAQQAPTSVPGAQPITLAQWLSGQAAVGAAQGTGAKQRHVVSVPNPTDVASVYKKVAQQELGHLPNAADTQAFVASFTKQYVDAANTAAGFGQQLTAAQASLGALAPSTLPQSPVPYDNSSAGAAEFTQNQMFPGFPAENPAYAGGSANAAEYTQNAANPPAVGSDTLPQSMQTLQDVINGQSGNPNGVSTASGPVSVTTAAEDFARNRHPNEAAANDLGNTLNTFLKLLAGNGGA